MERYLKKRLVALLVILLGATVSVPTMAAEQTILEPNLPQFNGIPIPIHRMNFISRELGGRAMNLDLYTGLYGTYESNIYQTATDEKSDWVITPVVGFVVDYTQKDTYRIYGNGQLAYKLYQDNDDLNDYTANISLGADAKFNDMFTGTILGSFSRSAFPSNPDEHNVIVTNDYNLGAGLTISPSTLFDIQIGGGYFFKDYVDETRSGLDFGDVSGFIRPMYKLTPNSQLSMKVMLGHINHRENVQNNPDYVEIVVGYQWKYFDAGSLAIEVGIQNRDYDREGTVTDDSDYNGLVLRLSGMYAFNADWKTKFSYSHVPREPENEGYNYEEIDSFSWVFIFNPRERFSLDFGPYVKRVNPSRGEYYTEYGGNIGVSYAFTEMWSIGASYMYQRRDYNSKDVGDWTDHKFNCAINLAL